MAFCGDVYKASAVSGDMHHLFASGRSVMVKLTICISLESFYFNTSAQPRRKGENFQIHGLLPISEMHGYLIIYFLR